MITEIIMPKLGETMEDGTISAWHKKEGEGVKKGDILLEVTTDKATFEVETERNGVLRKVLFAAGEEPIPVITVIGYIADSMDEALPPLEKLESKTEVEKLESETPCESVKKDLTGPRVKASPFVKRLAKEKGIDLSQITGTGPDGRITKEDIKKAPAGGAAKISSLNSIMKIAAERLVKSKQEAPHYYVQMEVDMARTVELRSQAKEKGINLTYTDLLIKAASLTLKEFPLVNATFEKGALRENQDVNIGFAVAIEEGLIVPVIKGVDKKDLASISEERKTLITKVKEKTFALDDITGGTFTISNLGMFRVDVFTAIINPPQLAILTVGEIKERPVVIDGEITFRPIMKLSLSADHRFLNGAYSAGFLKRIKEILEDPNDLSIS